MGRINNRTTNPTSIPSSYPRTESGASDSPNTHKKHQAAPTINKPDTLNLFQSIIHYIINPLIIIKSMTATTKLIIIAACLLVTNCQNLYTLALLPTDRGARCLDGTPVGVYYHEGKGANKNKYMIYMNSGGFCAGLTIQDTLESCYRRSSGSLGSTARAAPLRSFDHEGLLSTIQP